MPHCRTDVQGLTWEEGPAAPLPAGCRAVASPRGQNAIKNNFYLHSDPYRPAAGRQGAGRPAAGR